MDKSKVKYLGDSVYVSFDGNDFCLMTESHIEPTNKIYIEKEVYAKLIKFVGRFIPEQSPTCPTCGKEREYLCRNCDGE